MTSRRSDAAPVAPPEVSMPARLRFLAALVIGLAVVPAVAHAYGDLTATANAISAT